MKHDLFMMFGISILTTRLNKSAETDAELKKMWETCMAYDPKWANYFRKRTPLLFVSVPGRVGQEFARELLPVCQQCGAVQLNKE